MDWINTLSAEHWSWLVAALTGVVVGLSLAWRHSAHTSRSSQSHPSLRLGETGLGHQAETQASILQLEDALAFHQESIDEIRNQMNQWSDTLRHDRANPQLQQTIEITRVHLDALRASPHAKNIEAMHQSLAMLHQYLDRPGTARHEASLNDLKRMDQQLHALTHSMAEAQQHINHVTTLLNGGQNRT